MGSSKFQHWLSNAHPVTFAAFCSISAFCTYFCMYAFRKPFTAATYEGMELGEVSYKIVLVTTQLAGYTLSKFIGVKVIAEMPPSRRVAAILLLIGIAELSLLLVGLTPYPYNFIWFFFNGLPLGMIWGLVFSFLEGRRTTEALGAALASSFIVSSFVVKAVGRYSMDHWGVTEFWMPFVTGAIFVPPIVFFVWMLSQIPPPDAEDVRQRTERVPMNRSDRWLMFQTFAGGLTMLIVVHMALTAYRDFRDNFAVEILTDLDYQERDLAGLLSKSEWISAFCVLAVLGCLMTIRHNWKALAVIHGVQLCGLVVTGISTLAFQVGMLNPFAWFIAVGTGLYLSYVPFHTMLFERLIAAFRYRANAGYLIYIVDSTGYLATVGVMLYKNFWASEQRWLDFFLDFTYAFTVGGLLLFGGSYLYFLKKYRFTSLSESPASDESSGEVYVQ